MNPRTEIPDLLASAKYLARDLDDTWWAYPSEPRKKDNSWWNESGDSGEPITPSNRFVSRYQEVSWESTLIRISDLADPSTTREERIAERFELITGVALAPDQIWLIRRLMEDEA